MQSENKQALYDYAAALRQMIDDRFRIAHQFRSQALKEQDDFKRAELNSNASSYETSAAAVRSALDLFIKMNKGAF